MQVLVEKLSNGNTIKYKKVDSGTCYHAETPDEVVNTLERARENRSRIRIWYGKDGQSWNEENDILGYVGRSTGIEIKIPLLINNARSMGGPGMLDHCIVKITDTENHRVLYQHPNFKQSVFTVKGMEVFGDGKLYGRARTEAGAVRLAGFMNGTRNAK